MKQKIEIRLNNLFFLIGLTNDSVSELAVKSGVGRATLSSIKNGAPMLDNHARRLETAFKKPPGWMDVEHNEKDELFLDRSVISAVLSAIYTIDAIEKLYIQLSLDGKVDFIEQLYQLFSDPVAQQLSTKTLLHILGVKNDETGTKK